MEALLEGSLITLTPTTPPKRAAMLAATIAPILPLEPLYSAPGLCYCHLEKPSPPPPQEGKPDGLCYCHLEDPSPLPPRPPKKGSWMAYAIAPWRSPSPPKREACRLMP